MDKTRQELHDEIIREFKENHRKFEEAKRELESNPLWQEMQKWTVIDWNDGLEKITQSGVAVTDIFGRKEWYLTAQDHCFVRNFPSLRVEEAHLTDCIFENCGQLTIEEGTAVRCVFSMVGTLFLTNTKVYDSVFQELHCDQGGLIISLEDSTISGCKFKDIFLENDNYLGDGVGDCRIEKCSFEKISTDREDKQLFICQDTVGKLIKRKREYDMMDHDSCTGLELVTDQFGAIVIGSFETYVDDDESEEDE